MADGKASAPPYNYGAVPQNDPAYGQAPPPYPGNVPPEYQQGGYDPSKAMPMPPPPSHQQATTIITQPSTVYVTPVVFGECPVNMTCPHCRAQIISGTSCEDGTLVWLSAGILCLLGCWLGCCLIPFCIDGMKDVIHSCPNCHARLGVYRRI